MRQFRVPLERPLIHPLRMYVKQPLVPHRPKRIETQAPTLLPRSSCHLPERLHHSTLLTFPRMQPHKHVLLHVSLHPNLHPTSVDAIAVISNGHFERGRPQVYFANRLTLKEIGSPTTTRCTRSRHEVGKGPSREARRAALPSNLVKIQRYLIAEKSVGRIYTSSTL
jgi:hypothetical protein